jgi:hypothetical protein
MMMTTTCPTSAEGEVAPVVVAQAEAVLVVVVLAAVALAAVAPAAVAPATEAPLAGTATVPAVLLSVVGKTLAEIQAGTPEEEVGAKVASTSGVHAPTKRSATA